MWALFDEDLKKLGPFDAVYPRPATAPMVAENTEDGEGELLLRRIRGVVGNDLPIVASPRLFTPNLSRPRMAKLATRLGRLSHLSAYRHGGDRQARGRALGPALEGEAAGSIAPTGSLIS